MIDGEVIQTIPAMRVLKQYHARLGTAKALWRKLRQLNEKDAAREKILPVWFELKDTLAIVTTHEVRLAIGGTLHRSGK